MENKMIGKYVLVRCRDAGVHVGVLEGNEGREAVLTDARRLWYWKPASGAFLSAVAITGVHDSSKVGTALPRIHLTETCEIIECSETAQQSLQAIADYQP